MCYIMCNYVLKQVPRRVSSVPESTEVENIHSISHIRTVYLDIMKVLFIQQLMN